MTGYRIRGSLGRRIVPLFGLTIGCQIAIALGTAQAQVQTQTATTVPVYQMPPGEVVQHPPEQFNNSHSPRIPGGENELTAIKNQPKLDRQGPAVPPKPTPSAGATPVFVTTCTLNSDVDNGNLTGSHDWPPDTHGAVGPDNIVNVSNIAVGVYDKLSCAAISKVSLKTFFGGFSIPATQFIFDPRVLYDSGSGRFLVTAESEDSTNTDQYQYFAVSTDSTGTNWFQYRFTLSQVSGSVLFCKQAANSFWDYPQAGYSADRWLITANDFGNTEVGHILSIDKAPSLSGTPPQGFCWFNLVPNIAPPVVQDSSTTPFFLSPGSGSGSSITRYRIDQGAHATLDTLTTTSPITITSWTAGANAPQPNGQTLDTLDGRFQSATIQNGTNLWNVHAVAFGAAVARLYQLSTTGTSPLFTKDLFTAGSDSVFNPSVATNATQAWVTASRTYEVAGTPNGNAAMLIFNGLNNSNTGWSFDLIATSTTQFTQEFVNGGFVACNTAVPPNKPRTSCRWGDYSSTQVDPSANFFAWGFNELITGSTSWNWANVGAKVTGGVVLACNKLAASHDFNHDCVSDILLENTGGGIAVWLMNNSAAVQSALPIGATTPSVWTVVGQRDLNGDSNADILFRATDGSLANWLINGATITSALGLGNPTTAWVIVGTGDFNNDGIGDLLLRGAGTSVAICFMNNSGVIAFCVGVGSLPSDWVVAGTGDFNGDGVWDILWRNVNSGGVATWLMNANGTVNLPVAVGSLPPGWSIAGTGDFDANGISDILLSAPVPGGTSVAIWFINSSSMISAALGVGTMNAGWTVAQTGDFNGNGTSDILWYNSSVGAIVTWLINGVTVVGQVGIGNLPPASWMIVSGNSD
jgi:hypothetical protein